jgi:molecular chaperone GrpE (heat shock protein)
MSDQKGPRLPKWPFVLADVLLLGAAWSIYSQTLSPMGILPLSLMALCILVAALSGIAPFILEHNSETRLAEAISLADAVDSLKSVREVATQIAGATSQWQTIQEQADRTATVAREMSEKTAGEARTFAQSMQKLSDGEKATLRVEVEKLRRAESEWLQVLVRVMDHVFALHQAALRSGKPGLIEQMDLFQSACKDAARRVGLAPFSAEPGEVFDTARHQWTEPSPAQKPGLAVGEIVAAGYTFRGQLLRPALVSPMAGGNVAGPTPESLVLEGQS